MSHALYELDIRLRHIEPPIWRTVEVPGAATLAQLHYALQVAMGWTNSHLHQFLIGKSYYGMKGLDEDAPATMKDESQFTVQDLLKAGQSCVYEYDFGDGWEHEVTVKRVSPVAKSPAFRCVAGARACPPEDCGGPGGYEQLLTALASPNAPGHSELVEWSNGFEPEQFELPKGGRSLGREMSMLKELAEGDTEADVDGELHGIPTTLVDAVLALEPMQRASLCALIAGSLAQDVLEVASVAAKMAAAAKPSSRRTHGGRASRKR